MSSSNFVSLIFSVTSTLRRGEKLVKKNINREITKLLPIPTALLMSNKNTTTVWIVEPTLRNRSKTWKKGERSALGIESVAQSGIVPYYDTTPSSSVTSLPHLRLHSCPLTQSYYNLDTLTTPSPLPIYGYCNCFPFPSSSYPGTTPRPTPTILILFTQLFVCIASI